MSIPRRDPNFTMDDLEKVAAEFLAAGKKYWEAAHKAGIVGAVIWVENAEKGFVLYSRGEYKNTILQNIPGLGNERSFGAIDDGRE